MDKVESVFLLMRAKDGRKRPTRKTVPVCKGELIQEFPQPIPADQYSGDHNFHVLNDPSITLWCDPTDVAPLVDSEYRYLLAVSAGLRIKEFHNRDKKEYVMNLITGNRVSFRTSEARFVRGRIRYLGSVEGKMGVYLGVEIDQDDEYRGKGTTGGHPHFRCGHKNAVWVSMDMVIYPPLTTTTATTSTTTSTTTTTTTTTTGRRAPRNGRATSKPSSDTGQQTSHAQTPAHKPSQETDQFVHLTHDDAEPHQGSTEFSKAKKMASKAWNYLTGNAVEDKKQQRSEVFKEGDCVVAYSLKDQKPIAATVRWIGMVKLSQESHVPRVMFAGLETNAEIDPDEEFPGTHIGLVGAKWGDFQAHAGHTKLYLPESMLMKATDHIEELQGKLRQNKQIAKDLNMTESQVVDGGLSDVDIQEQEKMLADVKAQHDAQRQNRRKEAEEEGLVTGTGKQGTDFDVGDVTSSMRDAQKAEWDRLKKENNEKETGAERKPYSTAGAGLPYNGSALPKAHPYPAMNVQVGSTCTPHPPGHPERVQAGYHHQNSSNGQDYGGDYRQQHPSSHQSDLSAGYHNQRRPSNDQQYQDHINAHPPAFQRQGSRPDRELQQYPPDGMSQAHPALAVPLPNYDGVQRGPTQSHHPYPPPQPAAMQNKGDEHHHSHSPKVHPRRTAAEKQQLVDQIPDWLKTDNVVGVKIPRVREPMTGTVKFVGVLQVKGVDQLSAGVQLDEPMVGCTDGTYEGKRLFYCIAGTGYFCSIGDLLELKSIYPDTPPATPATGHAPPIPATRAPPVAGGTGYNNPLSNYACYEKEDQLGGPALFSQYIGEPRGIQGHHNSCYLDSTVFGLFALSDAFDVMFLDAASQSLMQGSGQEEEYCMKTKEILWKGIVNPLRKNGVARFESVMELRNYLEHLGTMEGANRDEKDPEEFLNMLFKKVLHVRPFISIKRPFGVEAEYFVQLFFDINPEKSVIPFTEVLLWNMFKEQNILFAEIPSKLLLQMPRFGKDFKMYNRIFPSLALDVTPILDPTSSCQSQLSLQVQEQPKCFLCNTSAAVVTCDECVQVYRVESKVFLCAECSNVTHKTRQHNSLCELLLQKLSCRMDLLSVICIETSHYVCFTRCEDRWLFHDSMADRIADMYNIPRVTEVTQELNEWVYSGDVKRLMNSKSWEIPECVRRFTQDAYMCVYVNPDMDMYN